MLTSRRSANYALPSFPPHIFTPTSTSRHRSYAKLSPDDDHTWWPPHPRPTPHQIFRCDQHTPYSKSRYYQLVKLYHPDHAQHQKFQISEAVRVERFRLVVAANAILSDPAKRAAYDRFGLGWNDHPAPKWWMKREGHGPSGFGNGCYGKGGYNDPSRNATWEDWEKFYQRKAAAEAAARGESDDTGKQETLYTSNTAFIAIVAFLASLGGLANISRANVNGQNFLDKSDNRSAQISRELQKRREEVIALGGKDECIQAFLRSRDPAAYRLLDERKMKMLPQGER